MIIIIITKAFIEENQRYENYQDQDQEPIKKHYNTLNTILSDVIENVHKINLVRPARVYTKMEYKNAIQ